MKKCALINDLSGFGKCSLMAQIPVLSVLGVQSVAVPTAVLSQQTGYGDYFIKDLTESMPNYLEKWKQLSPRFDGVITGFFANEKQIKITSDFLDEFCDDKTIILVDPVMGDDNEVYSTYSKEKIDMVKKLCEKADIITPNVTELKILTGENDISVGANKMLKKGLKAVVVTGVKKDSKIGNCIFTNYKCEEYYSEYISGSFSGTGDLFSSILMGKLLNNKNIFDSTNSATHFLCKVIKNSNIKNRNDGIDFEPFLKEL